MGSVGRVLRIAAGLVLGALTALPELALAIAALLFPHRLAAPVAAAVGMERGRVARWFDDPTPPVAPAVARSARYLAARAPVGLLGGAILGLLGLGMFYAATLLYSWILGVPWLDGRPSEPITGEIIAAYTLPGIVLLYVGLAGAAAVARWERRLLRHLDAPTADELATRVSELAESRDAVIAAVDDERRRIERDLHDGVQQRLVALGMLLGRARRHPERTDLVGQAHEEVQRALVELRDVSWRVYPAALDTQGLAAALDSVAERAPLPVRITCDLPAEPPPKQRAVAWFVVCEAVTNAAKHSGAARVDVRVTGGDVLRADVTDDGRGGADPAGGGLAGLGRRVAAVDGTMTITSPPGGPTTVSVELPCV